MKALSTRQPWADLIIQGKKRMDLRTWHTPYRGRLAIYASLTIERAACAGLGLQPERLTVGAVIGVVELVNVIPLDRDAYEAHRQDHLGARRYRDGLYGWVFAHPTPLENPQPVRGRYRLFEVALDQPAQTTPPTSLSSLPTQQLSGQASLPFELRVLPETNGNIPYKLALFQREVESASQQPFLYTDAPAAMRKVVTLGGEHLRLLADAIMDALRLNNYQATDLRAGRSEPFFLDEETGVRLALLFLSTKPVSKVRRIEAIAAGIHHMTSEELYYWYSKCTAPQSAERARKALRVLLAEE